MKRIILLSLLCSIASIARSADITKLIHETQHMVQGNNNMNMVWWIPNAFWEETLKQSPQMTEELREQFLAVLEDYSVFVIINVDTGVFGGMTAKSREMIIENTELRIGEELIELVAPESMSSDAANFFMMMKPMMAPMMGQMGEGMVFLAYPNHKDGQKLIDPLEEGSFTVTSFGESFHWRLPLGSLMPPMYDLESGESFPGNYRFNPFTGSELVNEKPE